MSAGLALLVLLAAMEGGTWLAYLKIDIIADVRQVVAMGRVAVMRCDDNMCLFFVHQQRGKLLR